MLARIVLSTTIKTPLYKHIHVPRNIIIKRSCKNKYIKHCSKSDDKYKMNKLIFASTVICTGIFTITHPTFLPFVPVIIGVSGSTGLLCMKPYSHINVLYAFIVMVICILLIKLSFKCI